MAEINKQAEERISKFEMYLSQNSDLKKEWDEINLKRNEFISIFKKDIGVNYNRNNLIELDYDAKEFMAMANRYSIRTSLSVERFRWLEKYQVDFGFGQTFKSIADSLKKSIELINKGKMVEASVIIYNLYMAMLKAFEKGNQNNAMLLCALFIVGDDEDLTRWDEQAQAAKIQDWNDEGYDVNCFFRLAANLVIGFIENFEEALSGTSEVAAIMETISKSIATIPKD